MKKENWKIAFILLICSAFAECSEKKNDNDAILSLLNEEIASTNLNGHKPNNGQTQLTSTAPDVFLIGAGKADITGPFVQSSTGYNSPGDQMSGLAMRLFSRAFVIERPGGNTVAIVTNDMLHMYQSVKKDTLLILWKLRWETILSRRSPKVRWEIQVRISRIPRTSRNRF
ncbi:neutral/alkaline non-lysosomal ceramidase N-terminal domain-containing protein [Leptospira sanjuanensis]|uniref:neutral/alkaline non-lysosomal ceramidase N-terminal domain-containing protein n=1 Tax=Leptospira sanjuanensis TaxID=2879643 RepID=UPI001EE7AA89|nr:neutral/alkaline non-lysosomal ceramidase N-terminal domain-containing protein [Leptospira sanjuanensis]MCG6169129.1 neutral/alkaline non-lysosomal ceramidase N-terminal domain-containing protein [Leptospira sanjuanensis]